MATSLGRTIGTWLVRPGLIWLGPALVRWWKRWRIPAASSERISILVAKLSGDTNAHSHHHSIREAINRAMLGTVAILAWPEELPIGDGADEVARERAEETGRRWLRDQKCDLLISGRIKSSNVVSLKFTSLRSNPVSSSAKTIGLPQTYFLPVDTMEFPGAFVADLGSAISACVVANIRSHNDEGFVAAIENVASQLERITESSAVRADSQTLARFLSCQSIARGVLFASTGRETDIRASVESAKASLNLIDHHTFPIEWVKAQSRVGAGLLQLGDFLGNVTVLEQAATAMHSALQDASADFLLWIRVQLILASIYCQISRLTGSLDQVRSALGVYDEVISQELRDREELLWAAAQHDYGDALVLFGGRQAGDDATTRALEAFGSALEVRTKKYPQQRSDTLISLSVALIVMGSRQGVLDWYRVAIEHLQEAASLVPVKQARRKWLIIQNDLGLALAMAGQEDSDQRAKAIRILREAKEKATDAFPSISIRILCNLGKALMLAGKENQDLPLLVEAETILTTCSKAVDTTNIELHYEITSDLGLTHYYVGILDGDVENLTIARRIFEKLCSELKTEESPFRWIRVHQNLGLVLRALGDRKNSMADLLESVATITSVFQLVTKDGAPLAWAAANFQLAGTFFEISKRKSGTRYLRKAQTACGEALSALGVSAQGPLAREARQLAEEIENLLEERESTVAATP